MSRIIKKRKDRSTYKKRQTRSAGSKIYATNHPDAKCPVSKKKMGTYVTDNRVGIELIGMSATRLNPKLSHHPEPLPHLEGKAYWYVRSCFCVDGKLGVSTWHSCLIVHIATKCCVFGATSTGIVSKILRE